MLASSLWQLLVPELGGIPWKDYNSFQLDSWKGHTAALITQIVLTLVGLTGFGAINLWIIYAFVTGRNLKQRLTDPAEFPDEPVEAVV